MAFYPLFCFYVSSILKLLQNCYCCRKQLHVFQLPLSRILPIELYDFDVDSYLYLACIFILPTLLSNMLSWKPQANTHTRSYWSHTQIIWMVSIAHAMLFIMNTMKPIMHVIFPVSRAFYYLYFSKFITSVRVTKL